jgi:hypothetical protein
MKLVCVVPQTRQLPRSVGAKRSRASSPAIVEAFRFPVGQQAHELDLDGSLVRVAISKEL